jgi:hypothetical protein
MEIVAGLVIEKKSVFWLAFWLQHQRNGVAPCLYLMLFYIRASLCL